MYRKTASLKNVKVVKVKEDSDRTAAHSSELSSTAEHWMGIVGKRSGCASEGSVPSPSLVFSGDFHRRRSLFIGMTLI